MIARLVVGLSLAGTVAAGTLAYRKSESPRFASKIDPELVDTGKPWTVLAFTSPMCVACKETPQVLADALDVDEADVDQGTPKTAVDVVDVTENPSLAEALDVTRTPTVAVVDHEGRVLFAEASNPEPEQLARVLEPPVGA